MSLLTLTDVHSSNDHIYLKGISLTVEQGEIVSLIGSNGAGKSTTLRTVSGMELYTIGLSGLGYVFKGRGIPPRLTVRGNLEMRAFTVRDSVAVREWMGYGCELFPRLQERLNQYDGTLSGGEQQMLAIARGLMMPPPPLLMYDEPSMGRLAPVLVELIFDIIKMLNDKGVTILLVEQNGLMAALSIAHPPQLCPAE